MTRHLRIVTPWDDPESFRADNIADIEHYERVARAIAASQHRAATPSGLSRLRRLRASIASAIARLIDGDLFYLITGAMVALDLVLVIVLARS